MASKPEVQYNTIQDKNKMDPISKLFIITEIFLGINRLSLFGNIKPPYLILAYSYSVIITSQYIINTMSYVFWHYYSVVILTDVATMLLIIVLNSVTWRRLNKYFIELSLFDDKVGTKVKLSSEPKRNLIQFLVIMILFFILNILYFSFIKYVSWLEFLIAPMKLLYAIEYFFSGHLLALLVIRLQLINYYLESSYSIGQISYVSLEEEISGRSHGTVKIDKIIDFYYSLINIFDILNDAVKWQLLFTFVKTFVVALGDLHFLVEIIVSRKWDAQKVLISASVVVVYFGSMFSLCASADKLYKEVLRTRDILACRLYQTKLDKQDRRTAQALLSLTETRNLSFSLFHMFNIDISLPFKIMGLLATYLIILLQFEKVNSN